MTAKPNVLITGAGGLVGKKVLCAMAGSRAKFGKIVALDIREVASLKQIKGICYEVGDICDTKIKQLFDHYQISSVVHLAAIVEPGKDSSAEAEYRVDVLGSKNIVEAAIASGVKQLVSLSSGAAYGYYANNPVPLYEDDKLRGNDEFTYSRHKRLVEEMLAHFRKTTPSLRQLILRPGTILGPGVRSPVSAVFEGAVVIGITGSDSPFVMILVDDVAAIIVKGVLEQRNGIYNLAGDGTVTLRQIAHLTGKRFVPIFPWFLKSVLWLLKALKLSVRGPEGVDFLRYRPVLANERLKQEFGFQPSMSSAEVFDCYLQSMNKKGASHDS